MEPVRGDNMKSITRELQRLVDEEESGVLALVIATSGSAPGRVGAKMLVLPDGSIRGTVGGGVLEARVVADALNALEDGQGPRTLEYKLDELGMSCGGAMTLYLEPMVAPRRVIIYGAGHVGTALAKLLKMLGCLVTVVDEREDWANRERLPEVDSLVNRPFAEALSAQPPGPKDHVLIVTRGHDHDQLVLEGTVARRPVYLGMIGSRKKAKAALEALRDQGVAEELINRVRTPMGLDLGAISPEEIAVSVAAELIQLWRKGELSGGRAPVPKRLRRAGGEEEDR